MATLLWFKRDLRVADHPALCRAAELGLPVLPVYVAEPGYWARPEASARQWAFVLECVRDLRADLAALGLPLVVRTGAAPSVLADLAREAGAVRLVSHEETGGAWTYARDRDVAEMARTAGIAWEELPQSGVVRRLETRDRWAAARDARMRGRPTDAPAGISAVQGIAPGEIPTASDLGLSGDPCPGRQTGGRREAEALLAGFLAARGRTYRKDMSTPLEAETACSRLSPHFAAGTLSIREAVLATAARQREIKGTRDGWVGSLRSFQSRLAWRDHFMQKLEDAPDLETRAMHAHLDDLRPRDPDPALLSAWAEGRTGIPFVDACMRYLDHTGWLNFRMRAMLVAVASYHLWLDWRATGPILAAKFTDYEPGIHWSQMQMQAGVTGINTPRIYNPVKQGRDQDPRGVFTRTWVPELRDVPDNVLQEPWRWEGAERLAYPAPVVDVAKAARSAREQIWAARRGEEFRAEAARVVDRHASRKDRRFVDDRSRRRRSGPGDGGQMSLDL